MHDPLDDLTEDEAKILGCMLAFEQAGFPPTDQAIAEALDMPADRVTAALEALADQGLTSRRAVQ